jgi:transposase InsO family protein
MVDFINEHREAYGVETMCRELPIAQSTYYRAMDLNEHPDKRSDRAKSDESLSQRILDVWENNYCVYGYRKIWHSLLRDGSNVARCTVARLMKGLNIRGKRRGKKVITTNPDHKAGCPMDLVNREFRAGQPNELWVADYTYVSTWQGFAYVAFVIDTFADRIVGWKLSTSQTTDFVLDALEQALHDRDVPIDALIHHSDRGSQYFSVAYTNRLSEAGIKPSVGTVGDSYDNALAETINGLYKTELIHNLGPWKSIQELELATLNWVHWYNHERLMGTIGYVPPAEYENLYYLSELKQDKVA